MNHLDSNYASQEGFRAGSVVVGYDRGDGLPSPTNLEDGESIRDREEFDPAMSYGQTRALFEGEFERKYVSWLLGRHGGNISAAAREARMDRKHLHDLAKKHSIKGRAAASR